MASGGEEIELRPQFGNRLLTDSKNVFQHNAWDNVVWDEEQEQEAQAKVAVNSKTPMTEERVEQYEKDAGVHWDKFYGIHQNRFFKDRHWLFTEFPELSSFENPKDVPERVDVASDSSKDTEIVSPEKNSDSSETNTSNTQEDITYPGASSSIRIFEVGCGVGNTVFPVLRTNNDPKLFVYCCDLSTNAIGIVKEDPLYAEGRCHGFVADVTDLDEPLPFPENSLDLVMLLFVLSAISPEKMQSTIDRLARHLKPGGKILFRDYGRYDLAQLRFKDGQCISDNFYARGDGTRVYFFTQDELRDIFTKAGLTENQNYIDRRLQVNRGKQLKMYRVWIQCKYEKPAS